MAKIHIYSQTECRNETDLWKLVQMVPMHLRSLGLRVASLQAKIQRHKHIS